MEKKILLIFLLLAFQANAQKECLPSKKYKPRYEAADTIAMQSYFKLDTLYIRTLNSEKKEDKVWVLLIPLIGVIAGGIITLFGQKLLKDQEQKVNSNNLKETKRIEYIETIYNAINSLSLYDVNNSVGILPAVSNLEKYVNDNGLYINKGYQKLIQNICDYYKQVATDFNKKDYEKELEFSKQFKNLFDK